MLGVFVVCFRLVCTLVDFCGLGYCWYFCEFTWICLLWFGFGFVLFCLLCYLFGWDLVVVNVVSVFVDLVSLIVCVVVW